MTERRSAYTEFFSGKAPDYSDFDRYKYAALAASLLGSKENARFAPGALEVLLGAKGLNVGEDADGLKAGTFASSKGVQTAIQVYTGKFAKARGKYSPAQLLGWYSPIFTGLDEGETKKYFVAFTKYTEPIEVIAKKLARAEHILSGEDLDDLYTDAQKEEAKATLKKYELFTDDEHKPVSIIQLMGQLDSHMMERLRPDAVDESRKAELKAVASRL